MAVYSREELKNLIIKLNRHMDWRKGDPDRVTRYGTDTDEEWEENLKAGLERAIDAEGVDEFLADEEFPDELVVAAKELGCIEEDDEEPEGDDDGYPDEDDEEDDDPDLDDGEDDGDDEYPDDLGEDGDDGDGESEVDDEDEEGEDDPSDDSDDSDDDDGDEGLESHVVYNEGDSPSKFLAEIFSALADDTVEQILITKADWGNGGGGSDEEPDEKPPANKKPVAKKKAASKAPAKKAPKGDTGDMSVEGLKKRMEPGGDLADLESRKAFIKDNDVFTKKGINWESTRALHYAIMAHGKKVSG